MSGGKGGGGWEHFPHEADIGIRGFGATPAEAFEQAALALTAVTVDPLHVAALKTVDISCEAPDLEMLLVDWLNSLLYESSSRRMFWSRFSVRIDGTSLRGTAWGEEIDETRHEPSVEVKGATYAQLRVARNDGGWVAQTIVDV